MSRPKPEYTVAQACDLARYFLGPNWIARASEFGVELLLPGLFKSKGLPTPSIDDHNPNGTLLSAESWRDVFRRAGVKLPVRPRFANVGVRVLVNGTNEVAVCTSKTYAERIARALNAAEAA